MNWYKFAQNPWQETQNEFINRHYTGRIREGAYEQYETREGISWLGDKSKYPVLHSKKQFGDKVIEFRQSGKKNKYVQTDEEDEIIRDSSGLATYMTDDQIKEKGYSPYETTIVAFDEQGPIGWVENSFGVPGVFIIKEMQGRGIGTYLLSEWMKLRSSKQRLGQMTNAGENMSRSYHKQLVQRAIEEGKEVSEEVLKDYPDLGKNKMASIQNFYKLAQNKKMIIARGISGSGKSTLAQQLGKGGVIYSTDDFFMREGKYQFDSKLLSKAHQWNQDRTEKAMQEGKPLIVIDNTSCSKWEMRKYVQLAQKYGYDIEIREPDWHPDLKTKEGKWNIDFLRGRNKHDVPPEVLQRMIDRYDYNPSIEDILKSKAPWEK